MPAPAALPAPEFFPPALLTDVLAVSLTAINLLRPLYEASGDLVDFAVEYLNPAAQRMTGLGERPGGTMRERFPNTFVNGVFDLYKRVFETGEAGQHDFYYQADGFDNYFQVGARRSGERLVVSFTDTADQPRTAVEEALRASQAREKAAYAEAEIQRQRFYDVLMQLPAHVALHEGPDQVFTLVNPYYRRIANGRDLVGQPIRDAWPELVTQGILNVLDRVYQTGEPFIASALPVQADFTRTGQLEQVYYDFFFLALRDVQGQITGVLNFSYDVTAQVLVRQEVEEKERQTNTLNEELAALNEELRATNEEYQRANTALAQSEQQQHLLNQQLDALHQDLEARVAVRTREAHQQRGRLERLVMTAPVAICVFDGPDWVYQLVNSRYQQLFPGRALLGLRLVDALPEVADQPLLAILHRVYDTGIPFESREVLVPLARTDDGPVENLYVDLTYQARYDEQGQIDGLLTFATDVTEQVRAHQQREAQPQQLRALFEQAPVAVAIFSGPTYTIDVANPLVAQLWGRTPAQVLGRPLFEALPEVRGQGFQELLDQVVTTGEAFVAQEISVMLERNGHLEKVYLNFVYQPLRDAQGRVTSVAAVATEVGEQVRARQQVQELNIQLTAALHDARTQRAQLQSLFEQAPVAICLLRGPELLIELANPSMEAIWGRPPAPLVGLPLFEALPEAAGQGFETILSDVLTTGRPFVLRAGAFTVSYPQGGTALHYYDCSYEPLRDAQGVAIGILCVAIDVTDEKHSNQQVLDLNEELSTTNAELSESNRRLLRTNADLDNFIYTASHDLKAPISNIEGLLLLLEDLLPAELRTDDTLLSVLSRMQEAVERFTRTIGHLTDVSKLQLEFAQPAAPTPLLPVLDDVRQDLAPLLAETSGQLVLDVAECPTLLLSEKNLRSLLYNLVSNALKYHHPDRPPLVRLSCRLEDGRRVLRVQDNGLGLSAGQQTKLFQLFGRLHTHVEGTGVGLYMVKKMVENAHGTLIVESQEGEGTTFTASFPA